jgi:hypothetical protein
LKSNFEAATAAAPVAMPPIPIRKGVVPARRKKKPAPKGKYATTPIFRAREQQDRLLGDGALLRLSAFPRFGPLRFSADRFIPPAVPPWAAPAVRGA